MDTGFAYLFKIRIRKKTTLFPTIAALIAVFFITSCNREDSVSVDQDKIWVYYRLVYDADDDITYARATFRFSNATGTKLELVPEASIQFNGDNLNWNNAVAYYEKQYAGFQTSGNFEYVDADGNSSTNSVTLPASIGFPSDLDTLSIGSSYELFWVGNALANNERVDLTLSGDNTTGTLHIFSHSGSGENSIILSLNKLQNLGIGTTTMFMDRVFSTNTLSGTSAGGLIETKYKANDNTNVVVEN